MLFRSRELISFTPFISVDPGDMIPVQIQVRGAWADFLIAGDFVDAFRVGNSDGNIGLFAQPIGTDPATIDFRRLSVFRLAAARRRGGSSRRGRSGRPVAIAADALPERADPKRRRALLPDRGENADVGEYGLFRSGNV